MRLRLTAAGLGVMFGFLLAWVGMSDPDAIRRMLLLEEPYLFLVFFSAVAVAFVGARLLRRAGARAFLTHEPIAWTSARLERRHATGSVVFGVGWAVSSSCPGPIAAQLGQGLFWSMFTTTGIVLGLVLFSARERLVYLVRGARTEAEQAGGSHGR